MFDFDGELTTAQVKEMLEPLVAVTDLGSSVNTGAPERGRESRVCEGGNK